MAAYRLISFDLDGTLVDTAGEIAEAVNRPLEVFGIAPRPAAEIARLIGRGTHELMRALLMCVGAEQPGFIERLPLDALWGRFDHHYAETAGQSARPYAGCEVMLGRLSGAGLTLACVTNKEHRHAERVLAATGLADWFHELIGGDTQPFKKPDARVISQLLQRHGVAVAQAAHLGDSSIDVATARNAGVAAWAVPHGYNAGVPIERSSPDLLFPDLPALADWALSGLRPA